MKSGSVAPIYARKKGSQDSYVVSAVAHRMDHLGYGETIFKVGPEPSTVDVQRAVLAARKKTTIPRQSPKDSKGSIGGAEGADKQIEASFRTTLGSLESHVGEIDLDHTAISWMVRHIGWVMDRFQPHASDGKTTYYRMTGKEYKGQVVEFGEVCKFHVEGRKHEKAEQRWETGVFVGKSEESDQFLYLTPRGMRTARTAQRLPEEDRWERKTLDECRGSPWNPLGVATREAVAAPATTSQAALGSVVTKRHFKIAQATKEQRGKTDGCPACRSKKGLHSEAWKRRFENLYPEKLVPNANQKEAVDNDDKNDKPQADMEDVTETETQ